MELKNETDLRKAIENGLNNLVSSPIRKRITVPKGALDDLDGLRDVGVGSAKVTNRVYIKTKIMALLKQNTDGLSRAEIEALDGHLSDDFLESMVKSVHLERGVQESDFEEYIDVCITLNTHQVSGN